MSGLFKWGRKEDAPPAAPSPPPTATSGTVTTSKVLPRVLAALQQQTDPVLVDLGPVVGTNISFFGERLSCKIHVEDLYQVIEAHAKSGSTEGLDQAIDGLLGFAPGSVDGILCWDLFDYLGKSSGQLLAGRLARLLKKGGVLYGFFGTTPAELTNYTRYVVESEDTLRQRTTPATPVKRTVLVTRDINRMFDGLVVAESVLLKTSSRETLFRKP